MKTLGAAANSHIEHLFGKLQHLRDTIDHAVLKDHSKPRPYRAKQVKVNHNVFSLMNAKVNVDGAASMAMVKDNNNIYRDIRQMNYPKKEVASLHNAAKDVNLKNNVAKPSRHDTAHAGNTNLLPPRFQETSMSTMDREVKCPARVLGRPLKDIFPTVFLCANLAEAAYKLGDTGGAAGTVPGPRAGKKYVLNNGHVVDVTRVEMNQAALNDDANLGLGKFNGPFFISHDDKHIFLSFRGSYSLSDWITDLTFNFVPLKMGGKEWGFVHKGFHALWTKLHFSKDIKALMQRYPKKKLVVTGHSLGAALAVLASFELALETGKIPELYTFGQPRVGGKTFRFHFRQKVVHYRFRNEEDVVPTVPPFYAPLPTLNLAEALLPERQFRIYYHAADISIKLQGLEPGSKYVCVIDASGELHIPSALDHSMTSGYVPNLKLLLA